MIAHITPDLVTPGGCCTIDIGNTLSLVCSATSLDHIGDQLSSPAASRPCHALLTCGAVVVFGIGCELFN